jgi:hypothetical protein
MLIEQIQLWERKVLECTGTVTKYRTSKVWWTLARGAPNLTLVTIHLADQLDLTSYI